MAIAYIRFGGAMGGGAPVLSPKPDAVQAFNTTSSSQATSVASRGGYARISATGGAIRYAVGPSPAAVGDQGDWVLDGQTVDIGPLNVGDRIAVIDSIAPT
jgi:hypothetical protein